MQAAWDALERNDFRFAERAAREALSRSPTDGEALYLLGSTLLFEGRYREALQPLSDALGRVSRRGVGYRLGHCHLALGDPVRAEEVLRRETQAYPESANAHNTLGVALAQQGRQREALEEFLAALRLEPAHGEASNNAGNALRALGRDEEALPYLERAASAQPGAPDVQQNLGLALQGVRRHADAAASFRRAVALAPRLPYALGSLVWCELNACDWRSLEADVAALRAQVREDQVPTTPFTLLAASDSPHEQLQSGRLHWRTLAGGAGEPARRGPRAKRARLRLAYLSGAFHQHATTQLMNRLLELHDRTAFEVIGVSHGPDDGSAARARSVRACDRFVDAHGISDAQAARALRALEANIAVDLDGHIAHARLGLLAARPAPVQATWLGYPGSTGADCLDYVIADRVVIPPEHERFFSEKVVCLPHAYQPNDSTLPIAERAPSRAGAGLPPDGFVFCCFNNAWKLAPPVFDAWMRLLKAAPGSVLWLLDHGAGVTRNLREAAQARGVGPARLVFAPRAPHPEHLARHRLAGLFLDTLPYNAHTTASDALWAGLPLVTCLGNAFAGRVAASLLRAVGLPELVTTSLAEYEALALKLVREPATLAALRDKLAKNRLAQPLFDSALTCRHVEAAYRAMWEIHQRGEPPRAFSVPA